MSIKRSSRVSFICGLLSLMFCWFFWVPVYGILISLLTIIFAVIAISNGGRIYKQKKTSPETVDPDCLRNARYGRVLGFIGLFIGLICFVLSILFTIYFKFLIQ
jgi:hypothetical protein